jgi:hypothetical protein
MLCSASPITVTPRSRAMAAVPCRQVRHLATGALKDRGDSIAVRAVARRISARHRPNCLPAIPSCGQHMARSPKRSMAEGILPLSRHAVRARADPAMSSPHGVRSCSRPCGAADRSEDGASFVSRRMCPVPKIRDVIKLIEADGWREPPQNRQPSSVQARHEVRSRHDRGPPVGRLGARHVRQHPEAGRTEGVASCIDFS